MALARTRTIALHGVEGASSRRGAPRVRLPASHHRAGRHRAGRGPRPVAPRWSTRASTGPSAGSRSTSPPRSAQARSPTTWRSRPASSRDARGAPRAACRRGAAGGGLPRRPPAPRPWGLPAAAAAAAAGVPRLVVSRVLRAEARLVPDVDVVALPTLRALACWARGEPWPAARRTLSGRRSPRPGCGARPGRRSRCPARPARARGGCRRRAPPAAHRAARGRQDHAGRAVARAAA